jgi:glycerate kinase
LYYRYAKNAATLNECGIDAYFPILRTVCSLDDAMNTENAAENLSGTAEQVFRIIKSSEKLNAESL